MARRSAPDSGLTVASLSTNTRYPKSVGIRMRDGLQIELLEPHQMEVLAVYRENGFIQLQEDRVILSPAGRLIADRIVREITF